MKKFFPLLLAISMLSLAWSVAAALPPAEKLLPDDTLALISFPDFTAARNIYSNSPGGRLWQDVSVKAFKDKFVNKLTSTLIAPLEKDLGVHFEDYAALPQGQVTLAITQNGWDGSDAGNQPGLLFLMDAKSLSGQLKSNLADLKKKWVDAGKKVRTETIREVEFSVITLSSNDLPKSLKQAIESPPAAGAEKDDHPKPAFKSEIYIGQTDSLLLMGNSPKALEKILVRLGGAEVKTVGDLPAFESNSAMFRDSSSFGWVNAKVLVDFVAQSLDKATAGADASTTSSLKPAKFVSALGFGGLKSVAFSYRFADDGQHGEFLLGVPEADRKGLFKIIAGEPKETGAPSFVPASAIKFQRWRMDGQKTWATLQSIVGDINPQFRSTLDFIIATAEASAKEKNPDFDIKRNLFGNLGDDFIVYSKAPKSDTLVDLGSPPTLYLIGSPNPEQLAGALRSLVPMLGGQSGDAKEREFLGKKIYSMPLPMPAGASLNYAFGNGYLAITTDSTMLEEFLRSSQDEVKPLRETPGLSDALQKIVTSGSSLAGYSNDRETMRATWTALKKNFASATDSLGPALALLGLADEDKLKEWADVSLMPDFDKIAKYFAFSVYSETPTPEGISFKGFTPVPPDLRK